jgi:hypothetical protein
MIARVIRLLLLFLLRTLVVISYLAAYFIVWWSAGSTGSPSATLGPPCSGSARAHSEGPIRGTAWSQSRRAPIHTSTSFRGGDSCLRPMIA